MQVHPLVLLRPCSGGCALQRRADARPRADRGGGRVDGPCDSEETTLLGTTITPTFRAGRGLRQADLLRIAQGRFELRQAGRGYAVRRAPGMAASRRFV